MATDYGVEPRMPPIPDLRTASVADVVAALKEWTEVRQGARGDPLDRAVTMRDLLNAGIATPGAINGLVPPGTAPIVPEIPGNIDPPIPPTPTNLQAAGTVGSIILTWEFARGYSRLAYFEIWRSETDAIGDAVLLVQTEATVYGDEIASSNTGYYYWVRAVSDAGQSPFNAVSGTYGVTPLNADEVLDAITDEINDTGLLDQLTVKINSDGQVSGYGLASTPADDPGATTFAILASRFLVAAPASAGLIPTPAFVVQATPTTVGGVAVPAGVYMDSAYIMNGTIATAKIGNLAVTNAKINSLSVAKLTAGSLSVSAYIESSNFLSGSTGWYIDGNGNAEFNNVTVRGTIYASAGTIGDCLINSTGIQSLDYDGTNGWRLARSGTVSAFIGGNAVFKGQLQAASGTFTGTLSAATGTFTGSLSAATGTFAGSLSAATGTFSGTLTASAINAVNTINVAGAAITGISAATGSNGSIVGGGSATIASTAVTMPSGSSGVVIFQTVQLDAASDGSYFLDLYRNGTLIDSIGTSIRGGYVTNVTVIGIDNSPVTGSNTYSVVLRNATSGPGSFVAVNYNVPRVAASGAKR